MWKSDKHYYKRVTKEQSGIYEDKVGDRIPTLGVEMVEDYLVRTNDCGRRIEKDDFTSATAIPIFMSLVAQLQAANRKKYCHNDVRIPNIVVKDGEVTLIDWDFALMRTEEAPKKENCSFYKIPDWFDFVSPDLYSLGCLAMWAFSNVEEVTEKHDWHDMHKKVPLVLQGDVLVKIAGILFARWDKLCEYGCASNPRCHDLVLDELEDLKRKAGGEESGGEGLDRIAAGILDIRTLEQ